MEGEIDRSMIRSFRKRYEEFLRLCYRLFLKFRFFPRYVNNRYNDFNDDCQERYVGENCIETQRLIQMIRGFNMEQMILRNEIGGYILENVLVKPCISYIYIYVGKCINFLAI